MLFKVVCSGMRECGRVMVRSMVWLGPELKWIMHNSFR